MKINPVYNLKGWLEENKEFLKPPVGNKMIYEDKDWIVMAVGGPNSRKDYHYHHRGPEFFYQVKGDITLIVMEESGPTNVSIKEGEIFLMPGETIHSPQRPANTLGIVLEAKAKDGQKDWLHWYCESCNHKIHFIEFDLTNIVTELPPLFDAFYSDLAARTCDKCNAVMAPPEPVE